MFSHTESEKNFKIPEGCKIVYLCEQLPCSVKRNTVVDSTFFWSAAQKINACLLKGKAFEKLEDAKKNILKQGKTHGIYEVVLPSQFFDSEKNDIKNHVDCFQIRNLHLHPFFAYGKSIQKNIDYDIDKIRSTFKNDIISNIVNTSQKQTCYFKS